MQIRAHLAHIGHPIANDDLYHGTEEHSCRYEHHGTRRKLPVTVYTDDDAGTLAAMTARPDVFREWCPKVCTGASVAVVLRRLSSTPSGGKEFSVLVYPMR